MSRRYEAIDLMKLYSMGSTNGWNKALTDCLNAQDINKLAKLKYQIQAGMDDLTKNNLNTPDLNVWFCRLIRSIEITAKKIIKLKHPLGIDDPLKAKNFKNQHDAKTRRDAELMAFMKKSSF